MPSIPKKDNLKKAHPNITKMVIVLIIGIYIGRDLSYDIVESGINTLELFMKALGGPTLVIGSAIAIYEIKRRRS